MDRISVHTTHVRCRQCSRPGQQPLPSLPPVERRLFINHVTQSYFFQYNFLTDATSSLGHLILNTTD